MVSILVKATTAFSCTFLKCELSGVVMRWQFVGDTSFFKVILGLYFSHGLNDGRKKH